MPPACFLNAPTLSNPPRLRKDLGAAFARWRRRLPGAAAEGATAVPPLRRRLATSAAQPRPKPHRGIQRGRARPLGRFKGIAKGEIEIPLCRVFSHCFSARAEKRCPPVGEPNDKKRRARSSLRRGKHPAPAPIQQKTPALVGREFSCFVSKISQQRKAGGPPDGLS